jgi:hypothetical protein
MLRSKLTAFVAVLTLPALSRAAQPPTPVNVSNTPLPVTGSVAVTNTVPVTAPSALPVTVNGTASVAGTVSIGTLPPVQIANQPLSVTAGEPDKWMLEASVPQYGGGAYNGAAVRLTSSRPGIIEQISMRCGTNGASDVVPILVAIAINIEATCTLPGGMSLVTSGANARCPMLFMQGFTNPSGSSYYYLSPVSLRIPYPSTATIDVFEFASPPLDYLFTSNTVSCFAQLVGHFTD